MATYNETSLSELLATMAKDTSGVTAPRLRQIEAKIHEMLRAVPKNERGLLEPGVVRYMIYTYFSEERGWRINGFEFQGLETGVSELDEATILRDRAPSLAEALLQMRLLDNG